MTQSNQQSAHAAAERTHSGPTLLGVSRRTAIKTPRHGSRRFAAARWIFKHGFRDQITS